MPRKCSLSPKLIRSGRWSVADARGVLAAQVASGLSPCAFAEREGLKVERLQRWRRELRNGAKDVVVAPPFVEVRSQRSEPVAIVLRSGRMLHVSESIDAEALRRIVEALEDTAGCSACRQACGCLSPLFRLTAGRAPTV